MLLKLITILISDAFVELAEYIDILRTVWDCSHVLVKSKIYSSVGYMFNHKKH